jgi:bifunctional non-homologous end joining protein LigD
MLEIGTHSALVHAAQLNVIEFHTWNATVQSIEQPDRMLFDLDPGEGVSWQDVVEGTLLTKTFLDELGLKAFLKTSGGKGMHVVVPVRRDGNWDEVKDFSEAVVVHLARTVPQRFVAKSGPKNRVGRIFIDYLRNGRGATTACAFSARARPGLGVSMPIAWDELEGLASASQWTIVNALDRLKKQRSDPWADYASTRQTYQRAAKTLAAANGGAARSPGSRLRRT